MKWLRGRARGLGLILWLTGLGCGASAAPGRIAPEDELEISFLDVGQGDATLVRIGQRAVLVDGGRGRDIILEMIERGVDSLVAVVASHNHDDHVGGLVAIVADLPVRRFYGNGRPPANDNARDLAAWLARRRIDRAEPPWPPLMLGDVKVTVIPPPPEMRAESENDNSLAVLVERGSFRALLTGDSERAELSGWLRDGRIGDVDVLKAGHHGARNGVSPGWIERTRPEVVVISVGAGNQYGHPDPLALRYYGRPGTRIHRTDQEGTITVRVDRSGRYRVTTGGPTTR